jgi:hypothetical protein
VHVACEPGHVAQRSPRDYSGATMPGTDTSATAVARQRDAFRRMTPEQRLALAVEMSDEIRGVTEAGIRHRHPELTDDEVRVTLAAIALRPEVGARPQPRERGLDR